MTEPLHRAYSSFGSVALLSFSGGRTSGFMWRRVLDALERDERPHRTIHVGFCNTGKEFEETLEFVAECERHWGKVRWLEYSRDVDAPPLVMKDGRATVGQHSFREVNFATASRKGEPFEQMLDSLGAFRKAAGKVKFILPNPVQRMCSSEMKRRTVERFMKSQGHRFWTSIVGLRYDEPSRAVQLLESCTKTRNIHCPLYDARVTEADVLKFWQGQTFDLKLRYDPDMGTYQGNCDMCFLKGQGKIKRLHVENPGMADWWAGMEEKTGQNFCKDRWTYADLAAGRVPLDVVEGERPEVACHCTD